MVKYGLNIQGNYASGEPYYLYLTKSSSSKIGVDWIPEKDISRMVLFDTEDEAKELRYDLANRNRVNIEPIEIETKEIKENNHD